MAINRCNDEDAPFMADADDDDIERFWQLKKQNIHLDSGNEGPPLLDMYKLSVNKSSKFNFPGGIHESWEYAGWGSFDEMDIRQNDLSCSPHKHRLGLGHSIAIAGNDLLASVLYTTGAVCLIIGKLCPISMILCALALYPFRKIFQVYIVQFNLSRWPTLHNLITIIVM